MLEFVGAKFERNMLKLTLMRKDADSVATVFLNCGEKFFGPRLKGACGEAWPGGNTEGAGGGGLGCKGRIALGFRLC